MSNNQADNLCGASVSWWGGEYDGTCELPVGHKGPHYDGTVCFDDEGGEVELKRRPIPPVYLSVGYYKFGKPHQVQNITIDHNSGQTIILLPEEGTDIRVEVVS